MSTKIQWTEATWNPLAGCTPVSPGCLSCYAATMAKRLEAMGQAKYKGLTVTHNGRTSFNGKINLDPDSLTIPLHRKKPTMYFVNSMSDLFHEAVPFEFIDRVFAVMALCPQHTFQVLTKRPERMAAYLNGENMGGGREQREGTIKANIWEMPGYMRGDNYDNHRIIGKSFNYADDLAHVWLGTSCENQQTADERIPHLLKCPAKIRFLSVEPLLGEVRFDPIHVPPFCGCAKGFHADRIDWVIVGGESGPKARPCNVEWIRSIVRQCKAAGVSCFVKQLGAKIEVRNDRFRDWPRDGDGLIHDPSYTPAYQGEVCIVRTEDPKGGKPEEWPEDLRIREMPAIGGGK